MGNGKRAIVVGVNDYRRDPLSGCVSDAESIAEVLTLENFDFDVALVTDADATRNGILRRLRPAAAATGSILPFYFAGHGVVDGGSGYILTHDEDDYDPGLSLAELASIMEDASANYDHVIAILDSCQSGSIEYSGARGPLTAAIVNAEVQSVNASRIVMAACRPDQAAFETDGDSSRGAFTSVLIDGLLGDAVDFDGCVTAHSLFDYVSQAMDTSKQMPVFKGDAAGSVVIGSDFTPRVGAPIDHGQANKILAKAQQLIDKYQLKQTNELSQVSRRRDTGLLACAVELTEISRWFEDTAAGAPDIVREEIWRSSLEALMNYRSALSHVGVGDNIPVGHVDRLIGAGGFGHVWKVDGAAGVVAYKVFHGAELSDKVKPMRFRTGYHSMKKLQHPRIVQVYELTEAPLGFTMQFIDGTDLRSAPVDRASVGEILSLFFDIADTVRFAHAAGVVHRDIKPENVVMGWDKDFQRFVPFLTDFDLAYVETQRTVTVNLVGGVINYAAPEQFYASRGEMSRAATVDVYALSQLFFFLVTGRDPRADRPEENFAALRDALAAIAERSVAEPLFVMYQSCTSLDPASRLSSVEELCAVLLQAQTAYQETLLGLPQTPEEVARQVAYAYAGPSGYTQYDESVHVRSRSNTVSMTIKPRGVARDGISDFTIHFEVSGKFGVQGASSGANARQFINQRIDRRTARFDKVTRTAGSHGFFETTMTIAGVRCDRSGVVLLGDLMSSVLAAIEDW